MRHLFLAAALLAAAPAHALEEPYSLAPGNYDSHGKAWTFSYEIGRREAALAHCPDIVRGPRYGSLERSIDGLPGVDRAAVRARIAEQIRRQKRYPLAVGCLGGLKGLLGYELARRPDPARPLFREKPREPGDISGTRTWRAAPGDGSPEGEALMREERHRQEALH